MQQLPNYGDKRQLAYCIYCGDGTETREHIPPRIFLDKPYPPNLPVVFACEPCNQGFSLDEEYAACYIECALTGSVNAGDVKRDKIKRILRRKPSLVSKLIRELAELNKTTSIGDNERVRKVILKLARGHAAFELNEPQRDEPSRVTITPLSLMSGEARKRFESLSVSRVSPEVGSRAMQRLIVVSNTALMDWIEAQLDRYRYFCWVGDEVIVRMVLSEYLACEVAWT